MNMCGSAPEASELTLGLVPILAAEPQSFHPSGLLLRTVREASGMSPCSCCLARMRANMVTTKDKRLGPEEAMTKATALAFPEENLVGWERALYAFLVEKQRRSGSDRTVQGYSSMLQDFFGRVA